MADLIGGLIGGGSTLAGLGADWLLNKYGFSWQGARSRQIIGGNMDAGNDSKKFTSLTPTMISPDMLAPNSQYAGLKGAAMTQGAFGSVWGSGADYKKPDKGQKPLSNNTSNPFNYNWPGTNPNTLPNKVSASKLSGGEGYNPINYNVDQNQLGTLGTSVIPPLGSDQGTQIVLGAKDGVKEDDRPVMKVINYKKIGDEKKKDKTDKISIKVNGKDVMASNGEILADLKDHLGNTTQAVFNTDQWNDYLNGKDINHILSEMPSLGEANKAKDGIIDLNLTSGLSKRINQDLSKKLFGTPLQVRNLPSSHFHNIPNTVIKNNEIIPGATGVSKLTEDQEYLKALKENHDTTNEANFARTIASMGSSIGGIVYNSTHENKYDPTYTPNVPVRRVAIHEPAMNEATNNIKDSFVTTLRYAMETGQDHLIPAIYAGANKAFAQLGEQKYNQHLAAESESSKINASLAEGSDRTNAGINTENNARNQELKKLISQLDNEKDQKTIQMFSDIGNAGTMYKKSKSDTDLQYIMAKHQLSDNNMAQIAQMIHNALYSQG